MNTLIQGKAVPTGHRLHRHMNQSERFTVSDGVLNVRTGLRSRRRIGPGEEILIPAGTPHTFSVEGDSAHVVLARLAQRYPREHFYLPVIPPVVQRALLRLVA